MLVMTNSTPSPRPASTGAFLTTRWTRVCKAKVASEEGRKALAELCEAYYAPVVTFLRCELRDADASREMAHAFFESLLTGRSIAGAEESRGRFRSYLLGAVKHFLSHQRISAQRQKRGGGQLPLGLDDPLVGAVPDERGLSPDAAYDRQWAMTVLTRALDGLRDACAAEGRGDFFEEVKPLLTGGGSHGGQAEQAARVGLSVATFRMALHRLKKRFREAVREEVAGTLDDATTVEEEMRALFAALAK
jgi:DNA-directed RNA polymerase specialized sigma24 family protein